jgi:hypothetical protein
MDGTPTVQINRTATAPLRACTVTRVDEPAIGTPDSPTPFAYVISAIGQPAN